MIGHVAVLLLALVTPPTECEKANAFWLNEYQHRRLQNYVVDRDLPPNAPVRLKTDYYATIIPQIANTFPGQDMEVVTETTRDPHVVCTGSHVASVTLRVHQRVWATQNNMRSELFVAVFDIGVDPLKPFDSSHPFATAHFAGNVQLQANFIHISPHEVDEFLRMEPFYLKGPWRY